jgi:hypothetical protein
MLLSGRGITRLHKRLRGRRGHERKTRKGTALIRARALSGISVKVEGHFSAKGAVAAEQLQSDISGSMDTYPRILTSERRNW